MSQSLSSGTYTEDFNYGYPYGLAVQPILPQFEYSTTGYSLYTGPVSSSYNARSGFSLQYKTFTADKNNTDRGVHAGAPTGLTDYYWLWPVMSWGDTYVLAINMVLSAPGQMTYWRAFDGHPEDTLTFAVNGKMVWAVSNSSGYGWTQDKIPLPAGRVRMVWTFQSSYWPPSVRRGAPPPDPRYAWGTPQPLGRYLRMTNLAVTNMSALPVSPQNFASLNPADSFTTANLTRVVLSGPKRVQTQDWLVNLVKLGSAQLSSTASITTTMRALVTRGQATLNTIDTLTPNSRLQLQLDSSQATFALASMGTATVEVPLNTVQGLQPRDQTIRAVTMKAPVIIKGRPVHPKYQSSQAFTSGSAHTWTYADPVSPTAVNHVLPVSGVKYRWVATDVTGANGDPVTTWPERSGGPAWTSSGLFCPTVWSHTNYFPEGLKTVTYARTVHFWNRYSQHMWLNLPSLPANGGIQTWQFVVIMHDPTVLTYNFVMDAGDSVMGATTTYDQQLRDGAPIINLPEPTGSSRAMVRQSSDTWAMLGNDSTAQPMTGKIPYYNKPVVITAIFGGALIPSYLHVIGLGWQGQVAGAPGLSNPQHYLMGRGLRRMGISWSSHMTVMEVAYYDSYLNSQQWFQNAAYLAGVYQFQNYR